jgi:AraC family transcriptional regulator
MSSSDDMLASLLATATGALHSDRRMTQRCVQHAAALLGIDLRPAGVSGPEHSYLQGGLASWQVKRLRSYIDDRLDSAIRAGDLAGVVRLSTSHFFRVFRRTFGESPYGYITKRRMERAQELMVTSQASLAQVALECGMCDQAHFSRTFRRVVGTNPGIWRRRFSGARPSPEPKRTLPGCQGRQEELQSQGEEFPVRIHCVNGDLRGCPLRQQPRECTARECLVTIGRG